MTTWEAIVAETSQPNEPRASCSETLGSFCANLRYAALPAAAIERVKHFFIDYLAIALRACALDSSQPVRALCRMYPIPGQATLLGRPDPVSPHWAALANGQAAHSMELDDTFLEGSIHTESSVFAACMALAEEHGLSGQRFVEAAVAGFEVACRVSRALQPAVTNARGFHPTGTCGALGAAAAAGKLLGLDARQIAVAIGVACSQASGLLEYIANGAWTKRFHAGWAAHAGLVAAGLAKYGMTAPRTAIEGRFGFLQAYSGEPKLDGLDAGLGVTYMILQTAMKYYPCNYYIQSINDSVLKLAARDDWRLDQIVRIVVYTVRAAIPLVCEPIEHKRHPQVMIDAQFSVPFNVALGLLKKRVVFPDFNAQMFAAPEVCRLMNLTTCAVDPRLDAQYPENWPARVEITLADGRTLAAETTHVKGDPRNPLTEDEVIEKHRSIVTGVVDRQTDDRILQFVHELERKADFRELTEALKGFVLPA
jgi:2-methylcitrate dehydratase PrpD